MDRVRKAVGPTELILVALLAVALVLRLWAINHGLPYVFNPDEELHFVPRAVEMIGGSQNPGYFENPPALTYLFNAVFRLRFTDGFPFGDGDFVRAFRMDPEAAFITARVVVALIGTSVVAFAWWAGKRYFDKRVGLVAAALIAFSFLPVFYSKQALNDVVTLAPVALALVACLAVYERGGRRDWLIAGGVIGLATAVKYTAGGMLALLALAALFRVRDESDSRRAAIEGLLFAGVVFAAAFLVLNPFSLLDFSEFKSQLGGQSAQGANAKLGQDDVPAPVYYLWTLTWGLGWLPAIAAAAGAVLALKEERRKGLLLIAFPLILFVVLSFQGRYFGRWLMPAYPALVVLAGYAAVRLADAIPKPANAGRAFAPVVLAVIAGALVAQGLMSSIRVDRVLAKDDTREQARDWLLTNVPGGQKIVFEPFIPDKGYLPIGGEDPLGYVRWKPQRPFQAYEKRLSPALIDRYRRAGFCWVVVGSTQKQRGLKEGLPGAEAYYERLGRESKRTQVFSPFAGDEEPAEFNFDKSFNYQPDSYSRPGPIVEIHELRDCG